ncbi:MULTISPECIES: hydrogenase maturation nickel metallochaperone HypA [unclassified Sphingobacterium]|jgi:hydrogenase nickel incorporation protein HypA/HybF|uniref:hydrogenase maturation nickel metallochaperone HypA/HybF n=1 Tax=unclassified Sphingobacterium TaxID=2609468 RepID=UPI001050BF90|nr:MULTISPECIES: hydrogenase maturation nickel metallochaperone HypA [unclassified Sphingobacterium]MBB2953568.1 hydrogenase nickel incorporation protein HypA/HybF [Sphingobacterium sp. JUb56]MCS3554869.1 hydrogenase nickel incorporation protein HypA/HybF [Sphingobacterium sp. JUb21]TCR05734.1 hydrogenase-3 nickel incorporation protein HypA [Sphingobacterium sp. JUb20]
MHELSIVKDIFDTLEGHYGAKVEDIQKIQVTAGLLSNVQPVLIQNAFDAFILDNNGYMDMELEVVVNEIMAYCEHCQKKFPVLYHRFVCTCGQPSSTIVQGNELYISKVIFKQEK